MFDVICNHRKDNFIFAGVVIVYGLAIFGMGFFLPGVDPISKIMLNATSLVCFGGALGLVFSAWLSTLMVRDIVEKIEKGGKNE